jgi:hypothetical protein
MQDKINMYHCFRKFRAIYDSKKKKEILVDACFLA